MPGAQYETHFIANSLLPFIFHQDTIDACWPDSPNWHKNMELLCCIRGKGFVKCNAEIYSMSVGDVCVINSDTIHSTVSSDPDHAFVYDCLIVDNSFFQENGIHAEHLRFQPLIRDPAITQLYLQAFDALTQCHQTGSALKTLEARLRILELLYALFQNYVVSQTQLSDSQSVQRVKRIMTYIRQNLSRSISLEDLSQQAGISKFHLSREFKAVTGTTIFDFINLTRCNEAKLLIESGMSVSAAAISCGYHNMSYFSRAFQKRFGIPPSHYLRK